MRVRILPHSILQMGRRGRPLFLSPQSWDELCKALHTHPSQASPTSPHFLKMCLGKKRCRSIQQPSWKVPLIFQEDVSHLCSERLGGLTPDACRSHLGLVFISLFIASPQSYLESLQNFVFLPEGLLTAKLFFDLFVFTHQESRIHQWGIEGKELKFRPPQFFA